jgi:hypothetical protein
MKKLVILSILTLTIATGWSCQKKSTNQSQPEESSQQGQSFNIPYNEIASGQIEDSYKYSDPENYDIYSSDNPLYFDKTSKEYKCTANNETAVVTQIFPTENTAVAGPSRMAYYCPSENLYWIRDFPGYSKATVYGPFQGKPE